MAHPYSARCGAPEGHPQYSQTCFVFLLWHSGIPVFSALLLPLMTSNAPIAVWTSCALCVSLEPTENQRNAAAKICFKTHE